MRTLRRGYAYFMSKNTNTYCYIVIAPEFVKVSRAGRTLVVRTILPVGMVEYIEVVMISTVADQDNSNEFQERRLSNPGLPNKKDGV